MTLSFQPPNARYQLLRRAELLEILRAAQAGASYRYLRHSAVAWLAYYPGDLPVNLLYGRALLKSGQARQAVSVLEGVCQADPEDLEAQEALCQALRILVDQGLPFPEAAPQLTDCRAAVFALGGQPDSGTMLPVWARGLRQARQALSDRDAETAEALVHQVILVESPPPLVAITHLKVAAARQLPTGTMRDLASYYHERFPKALAPALLLAEALMEGGESDKAVSLLHHAAASDVTGQVVTRLWGAHHPYREIWPDHLEAPLELSVPAEIAGRLGWNRLPAPSQPYSPPVESDTDRPAPVPMPPPVPERPRRSQPDIPIFPVQPVQPVGRDQEILPFASSQPAAQKSNRPARPTHIHQPAAPNPQPQAQPAAQPVEPVQVPESLRSVQAELERVAASLRRSHLASVDGRFPVYIILTTRQGLEKQYGAQGAASIAAEIQRLAKTITAHRDWIALPIYADDPACMAHYNLPPASPGDPWALKLALADLDASLGRQGERIAALLIVGGPEVVPFHHLPNPVDDADAEVPSDNPYATRDENYFIPEWPVGRLPGGKSSDPAMLINILRQINSRHAQQAEKKPWFVRILDRLRNRFQWRRRGQRPSWGYTAAIWRRASLSVFRPIGDPHGLVVSPPVQAGQNGKSKRTSLLPASRLSYFNLHGLQDAGEWYGQRDPAEPQNSAEAARQPDYPIALRPRDIVNGGRAPQVVFSEACYGANVLQKGVEEAISLKFLASGSQVVAGSTCTSYGSIATPLIAADLLGHAFWKYMREGYPAGEALRRGKIHLAREMHNRQGYLDGEDQKTLISFVLYGDPLAAVTDEMPGARSIQRAFKPMAQIKTVCDRASLETAAKTPGSIPAETMAQVKKVVAQYLPGMRDARVSMCEAHAGCSGEGHTCPSSHFGAKLRPPRDPGRSVVILSKHITETAGAGKSAPVRIHHHYARLTLDKTGKLLKLSVSR